MPHPRDDARLWQVEAFGGLEVMRAHLITFAFSPHTHEEFMIAVTEGGHGAPRFWGSVQRVGPRDVFILSPGEVHSGGPAEGANWRYRGMYVPADLMRRAAQELSGADRGIPHFPREVFDDAQAVTLLRRAHGALEAPSSTLARESCLLDALVYLITRHGVDRRRVQPVGREHRAVGRAQEYLESCPGENVSLERLADVVGLSPFHLCRVFRQQTGLSPHAYQLGVRVKRAKELLARGAPPAQVAVETGFFDQAHLTRHFKRIYGVTPGAVAQVDGPPR